MTETEITQFKQAAAESLPKLLYTQIEPHFDLLFDNYDSIMQARDWYDSLSPIEMHDLARTAFIKANEPMWPDFARKCWPEIDQFFNLAPTYETNTINENGHLPWDDEDIF